MAMKEGERCVCPESNCECEVTVTRGPKEKSLGHDEMMRCCCGALMEKETS